jgi:PAS domain S-box-containing protein
MRMSSEKSQFSSVEGPQAALLRELSQLGPETGFAGSMALPLEGRTETEPPFRGLLDSLPAAIYSTDAAGRITFYNEAAVTLWGCRPQLGKSEWCGSWRLYWPDGSPMPHDQCPMALALKEGRPIRGMDAIAERPDGSRVHFLPYPTPLYDEAGTLVGAVNMLVDITDRWQADEIGQRLASIVESSDDSIVSTDPRGIVTSWNRGAERLFGYAAGEMIGRPITAMIPGDRRDEELRILERIRRGERIDHYETVRRHKDGSLVEVSLTVSPIRNVNGRIIGASKIARDITDRKRAEERQTLLLREMNHRVKNLFTLASGVVALSARTARASGDIAEAVRQRLAALSRAHELTLLDLGGGEDLTERATTLHALVRTIVAPYSDPERGHDERVVIEGPDVPVGGNAVTSLALLLHEFATNATKYGALSSPEGRVDVRWSVQDGELRLTWTEQGGPLLAAPPASEGFGSLLARTTMSAQFGGRISRDWRPEGLVAQLSLPIERLAK